MKPGTRSRKSENRNKPAALPRGELAGTGQNLKSAKCGTAFRPNGAAEYSRPVGAETANGMANIEQGTTNNE
jgi:hypothetical protein